MLTYDLDDVDAFYLQCPARARIILPRFILSSPSPPFFFSFDKP
jgi:hypothetical protein